MFDTKTLYVVLESSNFICYCSQTSNLLLFGGIYSYQPPLPFIPYRNLYHSL